MSAALLAGLLLPSCHGPSQPIASVDQDLVWIEGRVILPEGLPEGEEVVVVSHGHLWPGAQRPRAVVGVDGRFRIGVPDRGIRVRLDVEADHLHMGRTARAHLRRPSEPVVLRPVLAAMVVMELGAEDADHHDFLRTGEVGLIQEGDTAFFRFYYGGYAAGTPDADLRVAFRGVPPGAHYVMLIPRDGFGADLAVVEPVAGTTFTVKVDVARGSRVSGQVVDEEGTPLPGVEVAVGVDGQSEESWGLNHFTATNDEGRFDVAPIPPGSLGVVARAEGYGTVTIDLGQSVPGADVRTGPMILPRGNSVTVEVVRPDGTPVHGASIRLDGRGTGRRPVEGNAFTYGGLGKGPFTAWAVTWREDDEQELSWGGGLTTWPDSYGRLTGVLPGTTARVIVPNPVRIEGRVVDRAGTPITKYRLDVELAVPDDFPFGNEFESEEVEDSSGAFAFELPPGRWTLDISGGGIGSHLISVPAESPLDLVAQLAVTYVGVVRDSDGVPVGDVEVFATHKQIRRKGHPTTHTSVLTAADGTWTMGLPAGAVMIGARTESRKTRLSKTWEGEPGEVVRLELEVR